MSDPNDTSPPDRNDPPDDAPGWTQPPSKLPPSDQPPAPSDQPTVPPPPTPPSAPGGPPVPAGPPTATPPPPGSGGWGAPPPPGGFGAPPPGGFGTPPPGGFGTPTPGSNQPAALPYQYGMGAPTVGVLATPGKRIIARIVDGLILLVVLVPMLIIFTLSSASTSNSSEFTSADLTIGIGSQLGLTFAMFIVPAVYEIAFTAVKGATPGKMLMKVRVVRETDGQIPGWGPSFMRWLPNLANICCSLVGLVLLLWSLVNLFTNDRRQTPFDLAAHTLVIDVS